MSQKIRDFKLREPGGGWLARFLDRFGGGPALRAAWNEGFAQGRSLGFEEGRSEGVKQARLIINGVR